MDYGRDYLDRWADTHSTSVPIVRAILNAARDEANAQTIWEGAAQDVDYKAILAEAWRLTDRSDDHLWWGECREERPDEVNLNPPYGPVIRKDGGMTIA